MKLTTTNHKAGWKTPARKAFMPEGFCIGATVNGFGYPEKWGERPARVTGQVWSRAEKKLHGAGFWWVIDSDGAAWAVSERSSEVLGQAVDEPLEGIA